MIRVSSTTKSVVSRAEALEDVRNGEAAREPREEEVEEAGREDGQHGVSFYSRGRRIRGGPVYAAAPFGETSRRRARELQTGWCIPTLTTVGVDPALAIGRFFLCCDTAGRFRIRDRVQPTPGQ
jgi:hypothetical protein